MFKFAGHDVLAGSGLSCLLPVGLDQWRELGAFANARKLRKPDADATPVRRVLKGELKFDAVRVEHNVDANGMVRVIDEFADQAKGAVTDALTVPGMA